MPRVYRVIIVDEDPKAAIAIQRYFAYCDLSTRFETSVFEPIPDKNAFVDILLQSKADAYVIDFKLNEKGGVSFYGDVLIEGLRARRAQIPVFMVTAFPKDAITEVFDVNLVYNKEALQDWEDDFAFRVLNQIQSYEKKIETAKSELDVLRKKEKLTNKEIDRLIELDHLLETAFDNKRSLSKYEKKSIYDSKISELLTKVDTIIHKIGNDS